MTRAKELLEQARANDAALLYCDTCGNRYYPDAVADVHDRPASACRKGGCLAPEDHHPFVEGPLPFYEQAAVDRRNLLRTVLPDYEAAVDALVAVLAHDGSGIKRSDEFGGDYDAFLNHDAHDAARAALRRLRDKVPA